VKIFITGIGTDVGKTIASAIVTEALQADYWKPIQAGDLEQSDSHKIKSYISNPLTRVFPNSYAFVTAASPHYAAQKEGVTIKTEEIKEPETSNHLVIEGAGGIYVPLNNNDTIRDIIRPDYKIIIVSRHYLGSINHTLLTIEALKGRGLNIAGIIFNGEETPATESVILNKTGITMIGRIEPEPYFDKNVVLEYAHAFREQLLNL
jgi:dethiobiotin synthetase